MLVPNPSPSVLSATMSKYLEALGTCVGIYHDANLLLPGSLPWQRITKMPADSLCSTLIADLSHSPTMGVIACQLRLRITD